MYNFKGAKKILGCSSKTCKDGVRKWKMEKDAENRNGHGKWKKLLLERTKDKPEPPRKSGLQAYTSLELERSHYRIPCFEKLA